MIGRVAWFASLGAGLLVAFSLSLSLGQSSASYRLEEHVLNSGGHPKNGITMSSASFRANLDSIGEGLVGTDMTSGSYGMDTGFSSAYLPPGEIEAIWFTGQNTIEWYADSSAGSYNLYRDSMSNVAGAGYGECFTPGISGTSGTDVSTPLPAGGWFYLVTVVNRLGEEGTKGWDSSASERHGNVCP